MNEGNDFKNPALQMFSSLRAVSAISKDFRLTMSRAYPFMEILTAWHANLPSSLAMEQKLEGSPTADGSASLHLAYQSVKILILRALLRPFNNPHHLVTESERGNEWFAARTQIRKIASAEADAALNLVSSLRPEHYQAFWAPCMFHIS
jgi:hypothetical protein